MQRAFVIKMTNGRYACETDGVTRTGYLHRLIDSCNRHSRNIEVYYIAMSEGDVDNFIDEVMNNVNNNMVNFVILENYLN